MSRSFRKRSYAAHCGGSQKQDKRICNRIMRRTGRVVLQVHGEDAHYLQHDEALNKWSMSQDGTRHFAPYKPGTDWLRWYKWAKAK